MTFELAFFFLGVPVGASFVVLLHTRKLLRHTRDVLAFNHALQEIQATHTHTMGTLSLTCLRQGVRIDQLEKRLAKLDGDPL